MAIVKSNRVPRGYEVFKTKYHRISDGHAPALELEPAPYLPVVGEDKMHELFYVVEAGQFVSKDKTSLNSGAVSTRQWLVPCNGGNATTLTYAANDLTITLDIDELETGSQTLVAAAGAASKQVAANVPCGIAPYNYISRGYKLTTHNNDPQPNVAFVTRELYEVPLIYDTGATIPSGADQNTIVDGVLIASGPNGWPIKWVDASPDQASIEQICGRCVEVKTIAVDDVLDKVHTVPGFELPGTGTAGRTIHEYHVLVGTTTLVSRKARINLMFL